MEYIIDKSNVKKRLDKFILEQDLKITRSYIKKLIEDGNITVNGKIEKSGYSLKEKDVVKVVLKDDVPLDVKAQDIPLDILFEAKI